MLFLHVIAIARGRSTTPTQRSPRHCFREINAPGPLCPVSPTEGARRETDSRPSPRSKPGDGGDGRAPPSRSGGERLRGGRRRGDNRRGRPEGFIGGGGGPVAALTLRGAARGRCGAGRGRSSARRRRGGSGGAGKARGTRDAGASEDATPRAGGGRSRRPPSTEGANGRHRMRGSAGGVSNSGLVRPRRRRRRSGGGGGGGGRGGHAEGGNWARAEPATTRAARRVNYGRLRGGRWSPGRTPRPRSR